MPESFDPTKESGAATKQEEAHSIYSMATEWIQLYPNWILGGDLNETLEDWDRKKLSETTYSYHGTGAKFIKQFLSESGGVDLWRTLYPYEGKNPESGHTCFHNEGRSCARLDYFLISKELLQNSTKTAMLLGEWYKNASDHVKITCKLRLKDILIPPTPRKRVVAIRKPNISALPPEQKTLLVTTIDHQLQSLLKEIQETKNLTLKQADQFSIKTANLIVETALQTRCRRIEEKTEKSKYKARISERLQIVKETCDLIRQLKSKQFVDETEEQERHMELNILIDQLVLCGILNLPIQLNRNTMQTWVELHAQEQIEHLEKCLKAITNQEDHKEREKKRDLFINPQTRGKWLDLHFKTSPPMMPPYAIDVQV
jgi:hypothetical protein